MIIAFFEDGDNTLTIQYALLSDESLLVYEKDDNEVEIYYRNDIVYHIMVNAGKTNVVWNAVDYEGMITGGISVDEAKQMIDSIYER